MTPGILRDRFSHIRLLLLLGNKILILFNIEKYPIILIKVYYITRKIILKNMYENHIVYLITYLIFCKIKLIIKLHVIYYYHY
jgi:hypothetical protein